MTSGDLVHASNICRLPESNVVHSKVKKNMVYKSTQGGGGYLWVGPRSKAVGAGILESTHATKS